MPPLHTASSASATAGTGVGTGAGAAGAHGDAQHSPISARSRRPFAWTIALTLVAITAVAVVSLGVGSKPIGPSEVLSGLAGAPGEASTIVRGVRIPRTILAIFIGAALGLAGAVMQSLTRNPLGDPGILGVNAGASAAVVTAIALLGLTQPGQYVWVAMLGAGIASVGVYLLGTTRSSSASPVRMALGGTALNAVLGSYVTGLMLMHPTQFYAFRYWDIGSLAGRNLDVLFSVGPFLVVGMLLALLLCGPLNAMDLGEEAGAALGLNLGRTRLLGVLAVTALCGAATAAAGPIGFVGLAVPHLARLVAGADHRRSIPLSMLFGVLLLLCADIAGRLIDWPSEVGAGVVTALVGAPFLVYLVRRRKVGRL